MTLRIFQLLLFLQIAFRATCQNIPSIIDTTNHLCELKKYNEAAQFISVKIDQFPKNDTLFYYLGKINTDFLNNHEEAIKWFNKALEINPNLDIAYYGLGKANLESDNLTSAEEYLKKSLEINPNRFESLYDLGLICYLKSDNDSKQLKKAVDYFSKSIQKDSNYADSYYMRGESNFRLEDFTDAMNDFEMYRSMVPEHLLDSSFYYYSGFTYYQNRYYDMAISDLTQYLTYDSLNSEVRYFRGICSTKVFDAESAIQDLKVVLKFEPNDADILIMIGDNYMSMENIDLAYVYYRKAMNLGNKTALKLVPKLDKNRLSKHVISNSGLSFQCEKTWSVTEIASNTDQPYNAVELADPYFKVNLAIIQPEGKDLKEYKTGNKILKLPHGNLDYLKYINGWLKNIYHQKILDNGSEQDLEIWEIINEDSNIKTTILVWGKSDDLSEMQFFIDEIIESLKK